ncbi:MAG: histidinol-phosphate transaminase [Chloroflexota bacterium]|nr:histidinol-phosphate transaminase [Chloroflexota bacterium]
MPATHGGIDYAELEMLGIASQEVLDFSANLNPFGPPPGIMEAINEMDVSHYPDSESTSLRRSLSSSLGIKENNIIVGNGSTELIRLAALAYLDKEDKVLVIEPTFGEYELACQLAGASVIKQQLLPEDVFRLDVKETLALIQRHGITGVFIANPNNPSGQYISQIEFEKILDAAKNALVVLDEAYISFVENSWTSFDFILAGNLLVLRSMTKDYAMAGLRLGYGVASEEIIANLHNISLPWNVNALAQKAGIVALENEDYLNHCRAELEKAKSYLITELSTLGLSPLPSKANFFLVEVGDARIFRTELLKRKILVRDCTSFGLPHYIRIAPRTLPECQKLIASVKEIMKGKRRIGL